MEASFVEAVAASLVREFLSKKGLKKTSNVMDEEFPRTALSINNRNELRNILHLQSMYKQNKATENPLKTILELMTSYFLENTSNTQGSKGSPSVSQNKLPQPSIESSINKNSLSDESTCGQTTSERNRIETYRYEIDEEISRPSGLSRLHPHKRSERSKTGPTFDSNSPPEGEKKFANLYEGLQTPELPLETRTSMRENPQARPTPSLGVKGMKMGPMDSSQEDSLKRRHLKRPSGIGSIALLGEKDSTKSSFTVPLDESLESIGISRQSANFSSCSGNSLDISKDHSPKVLFSPYADTGDEIAKRSAGGRDNLFAKLKSERQQTTERKPTSSYNMEMNEESHHLNIFPRHMAAGSKNRARSPQKSQNQFSDCRKTPTLNARRDYLHRDVLELVDVEDDETEEEACKIPDPSTLYVLQVTSKPIDFFLARDLKTLLFGSSLGCFNEEWKIQSFAFNNSPQLKYGIIQKKGGPCGVLAAVQACVLRHLIFGDSNRNSNVWCIQTSEAHRTKCLTLALASILWRAGSSEKAVVALSSGTQQFTPAGKYKADGILETLMLHFLTKYEDLLMFLQQHIHQFEAGPYGCILLTLSVILSRSIDQVRGDFDVITNQLIGAHGYCTQELVNLLLTGKAASNVFNDVMGLDSGNGNVTVLKGITGRSDVGLLSLFEHYSICQPQGGTFASEFEQTTISHDIGTEVTEVGCYLKTPKFPIWLVCSESHFSVLFCLKKDLLGDWKMERQFDLYYYDGLANQQEEIRLTIDTSQPYAEDKENDLIPPLEHCIRTKWKGAVVNWNGTEPIL